MSIGQNILNIGDAVVGSLAECFVTINGNRYNMFNMTEFESKIDVTKKEIGILGRTGKASRPTGWKGTWKGKMHYNSPMFRNMLLEFKKTGKIPSFEIQVTNEDPSSDAGRQTIIHKECYLDGGILAKFSSTDEDFAYEDISGTFSDFEIPEAFSTLEGMQ